MCLLSIFGRKYTAVVSMDQRQCYKDDFNAEYDEYRTLHARVENITRRFTQLDAQCRRLLPGTKEYQVRRLAHRLLHYPAFILLSDK